VVGVVVVGVVVVGVPDVPDVGGELGAAPPGPGGEPAATDVEGETPVEVPGSPPRVRLADLVWKLRTPASPAAVATMTIGARLIERALSTSASDPSLLV
jgi:hypothetical protein